jgi:hypothetical protein
MSPRDAAELAAPLYTMSLRRDRFIGCSHLQAAKPTVRCSAFMIVRKEPRV